MRVHIPFKMDPEMDSDEYQEQVDQEHIVLVADRDR